MARFSKRLDSVSSSGPPPEISITPIEFEELEAVYDQSLSDDVRAEIGWVCNLYLRWNESDHNAQTYADVRELMGPIQQSVEKFSLLAFGSLTPVTDAGNFLEWSLDEHLAAPSGIILGPADLEFFDGDSFVPLSDETAPLRLRLSTRVLEGIAYHMGYAIHCVAQDIDKKESDPSHPSWTPGNAHRDWVRAMQNLAAKHSLPGGAYTSIDKEGDKKKPTKFAEFLFALNKLFPDQHRTDVETSSAMAERIKSANRRAKGARKAAKGSE